MTPLESFSDTVHPTPLVDPAGSRQPPQPTNEMALLLARFAQMQADLAAMKLTVERQSVVINRQRGVIEQSLDEHENDEDQHPTEREPVGNALRPIDKKLVDKPKIYKGVLSEFVDWQENLKVFLEAQDPRWRGLLDAIEVKGFTKLDVEAEEKIAKDLGIQTQAGDFKKQIYTYLTAYTGAGVRNRVLAGKVDGSWEVWRHIADRGRSRRAEHLHKLREKVMFPTNAMKLA